MVTLRAIDISLVDVITLKTSPNRFLVFFFHYLRRIQPRSYMPALEICAME